MVGKVGAYSAVHRRQLASLMGLLSFFSKAVPASRAYFRRLYSCLHEGVEVARDYDVDVTLTQEAKGDLLWWHTALLRFRDSQIWRGEGAKVLKQHTDASGDGWVVGFQVNKLKEAALCALHALSAIFALGDNLARLARLTHLARLAHLKRAWQKYRRARRYIKIVQKVTYRY
jgi:hypothetical protein